MTYLVTNGRPARHALPPLGARARVRSGTVTTVSTCLHAHRRRAVGVEPTGSADTRVRLLAKAVGATVLHAGWAVTVRACVSRFARAIAWSCAHSISVTNAPAVFCRSVSFVRRVHLLSVNRRTANSCKCRSRWEWCSRPLPTQQYISTVPRSHKLHRSRKSCCTPPSQFESCCSRSPPHTTLPCSIWWC